MDDVLTWLGSLPAGALYAILALVAATENFFPPIPADVIVAFGSFLAARSHRSPLPTILSVVIGNVAGAFGMFILGRRFGAAWIHRHLRRVMGERAEQRVQGWYNQYGLPALFISRFVPGVRAVVPPLAGAIRVPVVGALAAIGTASTIWYATVAILAYRLGSQWERVVDTIKNFEVIAAIVVGVMLVAGVAAWWIFRRRRAKA